MNPSVFYFFVFLSLILFSSFVAATDADIGSITTATPGTAFTCQYIPNYLLSGVRHFQDTALSLDLCRSACEAQSDCVGFVFRPQTQQCVTITDASFIRPNESTTEEIILSYMCRGSTPPAVSYCQPSRCAFADASKVEGIIMPTDGILHTATKEECCALCQNANTQEMSCATFQYNTATLECTRFAEATRFVYATSEFVSGLKRCIPSDRPTGIPITNAPITTTARSTTTTTSTTTLSITSTPASSSSNSWYVVFSFRGVNGDNHAAAASSQWSDALQEFSERFSLHPESMNKSDFFYSFATEENAVEFIAFIIGRFDAERRGSLSAWKFFIDSANANQHHGKPFLFI